MRKTFSGLSDFFARLFSGPVLPASPLSAADEMMNRELLDNVRQIIRLGEHSVALTIGGEQINASVHGCALYIPDGCTDDGHITYFAIVPDLSGEYYQADHFFILTSFCRIRSLSYLYSLRDATSLWLNAFYDIEDQG